MTRAVFSELDPLMRGLAVGALGVTALGIWRSDLARDARLATLLACLSAAAWTLTESERATAALGNSFLLSLLAFPVAGFFWLFVLSIFDDRRVTPSTLAPAVSFVGLGIAIMFSPVGARSVLGLIFNIAAALLCLHAAYVVFRGRRDDLVESRRSLRTVILGFAAIFAATQGGLAVAIAFDPAGPWRLFGIQSVYGAITVGVVAFAMGGLFLKGRTPLLGSSLRPERQQDPRLVAAEAVLLAQLSRVMDDGAWRDEALNGGMLARRLGVPEHQLRALINGGLGYRNFAAFLNGYRVTAAKARLEDPAQARTTIAAIAFEVGYGSLSPFNRAFLTATGESPNAWRQRMLRASNMARSIG